jgi:D-alanyl-D-alanine carboxypeptidase
MRGLIAVFAGALCIAALPTSGVAQPRAAAPPAVGDVVRSLHARYHVPAMAGTVVNGRSIDSAVVGKVRADRPAHVTDGSRFQVGSLSKAILATAFGTLVEDKKVTWSSTLADVFPKHADEISSRLRHVTMRTLLTHHGGLQAFTGGKEFRRLPHWHGPASAKQRKFVWWLLRQPPAYRVGSFHYSNADYAVVARVMERMTGHSWRELIRHRVFEPLHAAVWFGWPARHPGPQPVGHIVRHGRSAPVPPRLYRVPVFVAAAGIVSLTPTGYARFLRLHLQGLRGHDTAVLHASTVQALHRPIDGYSAGWIETSAGSVPLSLHDGTAGTFYAWAGIEPTRNIAAAGFTNVGGSRGNRATTAFLQTMLGAGARK